MNRLLLRSCVALLALLAVAGYFAYMRSSSTPNIAEDAILQAAIGGDPVAMYRVGAQKSDNRDTYAWFVVSTEYIASAPAPHSVEVNRTEMEVRTAVNLFRQRFSDSERSDAERRAGDVRKLIRTR